MPRIRLLLADQELLTREALEALLSRFEELEIIEVAGRAEQVLRRAAELHPDVVLLDAALGRNLGAELEGIASESNIAGIVILERSPAATGIMEWLRAGVSACVTREDNVEMLLAAIRSAAEGAEAWLSPRAAAAVVKAKPRTGLTPDELLSERELQIARMAALGDANEAIGKALHIATGTVRNHLSQIYEKLGVTSRTDLVIWCWQHRIVEPGDAR